MVQNGKGKVGEKLALRRSFWKRSLQPDDQKRKSKPVQTADVTLSGKLITGQVA